ncbi:probable serine/threonine-protein kinase dyrk1 [Octopus sinensis]|uniref:Probable serine/threonine-protein kinase dyrk1 n=1 Tax=Octopus sinensis TaxID=2607531 RepID=A0A6P7S427_9MOLL|nr:probable serine/threonine-protein kinase dyrk1 [Octopus sinensis]
MSGDSSPSNSNITRSNNNNNNNRTGTDISNLHTNIEVSNSNKDKSNDLVINVSNGNKDKSTDLVINVGSPNNNISSGFNNSSITDISNHSIHSSREYAGDIALNSNDNGVNNIESSGSSYNHHSNKNAVLISETNPNRIRFLSSNSKIRNAIYQCRVYTGSDVYIYIGASSSKLAVRISNHFSTFRDKEKQHATGLNFDLELSQRTFSSAFTQPGANAY